MVVGLRMGGCSINSSYIVQDGNSVQLHFALIYSFVYNTCTINPAIRPVTYYTNCMFYLLKTFE